MRGLLTKAQRRVLQSLKDAEDSYRWADAEIVNDHLEYWYGTNRTSGRLINALLGLCLLSSRCEQGVWHYTLNEEARAILADPLYRPKILELL